MTRGKGIRLRHRWLPREKYELSPPHRNPRGLGQSILAVQTRDVKGRPLLADRRTFPRAALPRIARVPPTAKQRPRSQQMRSMLAAACNTRGYEDGIVAVQTTLVKRAPNVRFGSEADICSAKRDVRFTLESGHSSLQAGMVISGRPKAWTRTMFSKLKAAWARIT